MTTFQLKLKSMVVEVDGHWYLKKGKLVQLPNSPDVVTTKRAIYASFVGPIDQNFDVVSSCGHPKCVAPDHATLRPGRSPSRALTLGAEVRAPETGRMDQAAVLEVVALHKQGRSIREISNTVGVPISDVVKAISTRTK